MARAKPSRTRSQNQAVSDPPKGEPGTLVAHFGVAVDVQLDRGKRKSVRVGRRSGHVVGDRVLVHDEGLTRLERTSELRRRSPGGGEHVVAANLDLLVVVVAPDPPPRVGLIDRCVVAARTSGIDCALVINKCELPGAREATREVRETFENTIRVLEVSASTGQGMEALETLLAEAGKSTFSGHSGVGKSSLTNRLIPGLELLVGALSDSTGRGKHTTTVSTLHSLPKGGELVDTPGIREFGLVAVEPIDLAALFLGFEDLPQCRFRNCLHDGEPGCALDAAVESGLVSEVRRNAYRTLLAELRSDAL